MNLNKINLDNTNIICICIIITLLILQLYSFYLLNYYINNNKLIIHEANNKNHGRGVFANKNFYVGDILEICPVIKQPEEDYKGLIRDYLFSSHTNDYKEYAAVAFGYCSIYNHSDNPNCVWIMDDTDVIIKVIRNIKKGEEIFISYGNNYWESRNN
jgi:SET domain-containing protein